jgi:hypothetical protein
MRIAPNLLTVIWSILIKVTPYVSPPAIELQKMNQPLLQAVGYIIQI